MKTEYFGITNGENMTHQRTQLEISEKYRGKVKRHEAKFQESQYLNHTSYNINK